MTRLADIEARAHGAIRFPSDTVAWLVSLLRRAVPLMHVPCKPKDCDHAGADKCRAVRAWLRDVGE